MILPAGEFNLPPGVSLREMEKEEQRYCTNCDFELLDNQEELCADCAALKKEQEEEQKEEEGK